MSKNRTNGANGNRLRRWLSGVLCLALLLGLLPQLRLPAQAAAAQQNWAMPYAEQLVDWGVMRGDIDGNLRLGDSVTRAEFVTFMNRAYGYTKLGGTPFTDVSSAAWYAQDIDIAYNVGYFKGTSPTTASPMAPVTREQAGVLLARNLMLQETVGETLGFSDSRILSEWSRGLIGAAAANGVINGYSDGSFRPQQNITRGEVAAMLVRSIGTPINTAGDYELGSVYGNVTINTSGVNLRNSVITGNLYLTGGVDLGDVLLENVNVLGQIVVSGAGESHSSQSSVILRNVEADEMVVDSIGNQFVTIRAEGNTSVGATRVRTNAYVDDSSLPGFGLSLIELDGENGSLLQLAGNVKEVVNLTPASSLQIVQGSAEKVTVDENAVGSTVLVDTATRVEELNLDVAASVTGEGDIKGLNVGAAGSTVEMLPDSIYIRPGITSTIAGANMTPTTAAESSADPRLLAGYPSVKNVAPNSATAVFSTNKAGTVYWALSAVADGSVSEEDLISPPAYGGNIVKSGSIRADASKTEYPVSLTGLTPDGSYYVTAILVDSRGNRSPLKVTAFTTPDNTAPAFNTGYPVISMNTTKNVQVTVMPNKSCLLYYALLPAGSTAPKPAEFKANAIVNNLGYGTRDLVKNSTQSVNVNSEQLDELTKYDLYLWLTDYNGAKSSTVRKITFSTPDETPPVITNLQQNLSRTTATAVGVSYSLNEPGTLHWVIYADDATNAFATSYGRDEDDEKWMGTDVRAKAFVKAGLSSLKKGSSSASKADTDITYAISGLNSKTTGTTSYMLYVVAEDKASPANMSARVMALNVHTLDDVAPTAKLEFSKVDIENPNEPEVDTDLRLVFSESVQGDPSKEEIFRDLYSDVQKAETSGTASELTAARNALAAALEAHITMWYRDTQGKEDKVTVRNADNPNPTNGDWVVDYRFATVTMENGNMVITLPTTSNKEKTENITVGNNTITPSALNLTSGVTYWFWLNDIHDTSLNHNIMNKENKGAPVKLDEFRIVFAHVSVNNSNSISIKRFAGADADLTTPIPIDFKFVVKPESVESVAADLMWDMLIWTNRSMKYDLYSRPARAAGLADDGQDWVKEGSAQVNVVGLEDGYVYKSLRMDFQCKGTNVDLTFKRLDQMKEKVDNTSAGVKANPDYKGGHGDREYAICITELGASYGEADGINVRVSIVAGSYSGLKNVTDAITSDTSGGRLSHLNTAMTNNGVVTIGRPNPWTDSILDPYPPKLKDNYPVITASDNTATVTVMLNQAGYVNYVAVPLTATETVTGYSDALAVKGQEDKITTYTCEIQPTAKGIGKSWANTDGTPSMTGTIVNSTVTGLPKLSEVLTKGPTADYHTTNKTTITNDKRYYLSVPESDLVASKAAAQDTGSIGELRSDQIPVPAADQTVTFTIEGLKSNTAYLLYLVTENSSHYYEADAECYRFTTEVTRPPRLELSSDGETTISAYLREKDDRTQDNADMRYYLVTRTSVSSPFTKTFSSIADLGTGADGKVDYSKVNAAELGYFTGTGAITNMTALDAMNIRCYRTVGGTTKFVGTLFDLYVKREETAAFISAIQMNSGSDGGDVIGVSGRNPIPISSASTGSYPIKCADFKRFEAGKEYVLVAMATRNTGNANDDNNYAFATWYPIKKGDSEPPKIEAAYINYKFETKDGVTENKSWGGTDGNAAKNANLIEATLVLDFTEPLYRYVECTDVKAGKAAYPIDNCSSHSTNPVLVGDSATKKYTNAVYSIGNAGGLTGVLTVAGDGSHTGSDPIKTINLKITNLSATGGSATVTLGNYIFVDENENGTGRTSALRITVELVNKGTGDNYNWQPRVSINGEYRSIDTAWTVAGWNLTL